MNKQITDINKLKTQIRIISTINNVTYHRREVKNKHSTTIKYWCFNKCCNFRFRINIQNDFNNISIFFKSNKHNIQSDHSYCLSYGKNIRNLVSEIIEETRTEQTTPYIEKRIKITSIN